MAAGAVRIASARYSLWFDELASLFFASQPLSRLWGAWMLRETNPPLFYSLLHGWIGLVGLGEVRLRLLPIAASLVAILVFHRGMTRSYGPRAALIATLLLASSAQQLYFSHQVRAYIFLYLAVATSFFGLMRVVAPSGVAKAVPNGWAAYVVGGLAGIYCHTTAILWPTAASLALMTLDRRFRPGGSAWRALLLADLAIVVGGAWWLGMTWLQLRSPNGNIGWMQGLGVRKATLVFVATLLQSRQIGFWQAGAPILIAIFAAIGSVRTWQNERTRLTLLILLWATGLFMLASLRQPVILDRTLFWLSMFPLTLATVGLNSINDRRAFRLVSITLLLLQSVNLALLAPRLEKEDWRGMVFALAADRLAVVLVDGEATSVAARLACAVDLGSPCPFPVVTLLPGGRKFDGWGDGYAQPATSTPDGRLQLPVGAHVYLLRRQFHDALDDVRAAGLADALPAREVVDPVLIGPLPPAFNAALTGRSRIRAGLVRLSDP